MHARRRSERIIYHPGVLFTRFHKIILFTYMNFQILRTQIYESILVLWQKEIKGAATTRTKETTGACAINAIGRGHHRLPAI